MTTFTRHEVSGRGTALDHTWRISRRWLITLLTIALVLVVARIALPLVLKSAINGRLAKIPDYQGRVEDVHVALWRGAYVLKDLSISKAAGGQAVPFFSAREIDFSLAWGQLFHRKIVSDIVVRGGRLNFIQTKSAETSQVAVDRRWQDAIKDIFPIDINYLELSDGRIRYQNETASPAVNFFVNDLRAVATGLRNRPAEKNDELPAKLSLTGESIGHGHLVIFGQAEPLAANPRFELRVTLERVSLPALNEFLKAYGDVDVASGEFRIYTEIAARDGRFEGYAKPFFSNVRFTPLMDEKKNLGQKIWQLLANGLVKLLRNKSSEQLAMRIPFSGEFGRTDVGIWATIGSTLRNGFIKALPPTLELSVKSDEIPPPAKPIKPPPEPPAVPAAANAEAKKTSP